MIVTKHFTSRWKKEWVPLATQQLRLRNLIQILAFSIKNDKKEIAGLKEHDSGSNNYSVKESYYFTLHSTIMSAPFYTSEKLKSDSPKWKEFQTSSWEGDICSSVDAIVIRLWFSTPEEPKDRVLAVWGVYLSGLIYLGPKLRSDLQLKPNSIVFVMPGGYFTDPKCLESNLMIRYVSVITNISNVRNSYTVNSLTRLQILQQVIKKEETEVEILKKKISMGDFFRSENRGRTTLQKLLSKHKTKTHYFDLIKVKESIEIARYRVNTLKEEKDILLQRLGELNKCIDSLSNSNHSLESKMMENYRILKKEVQNHREWKRNYIDKREKYLHSKAMLNFRTKQLISELNLIYPIEEISPEKYAICGVHLPNSEDFAGHDDLQISIALGFVTHVIQMISVFLQIPLRYPVIHYGSRSRIVDQITDKIPDSEREFSLFVKGREKLQFHYAVYLLNKNIAQMRWLCGLPTSDLRNTLENLSSLLKMKFGNTILDQQSRSLSSSTADICSSTLSVSSPLGSITSFQIKKNPRIYHVSESSKNIKPFSPQITEHHMSASVGSSKDLMINVISEKTKILNSKKKELSSNLSFSLDKGLNEYEELLDSKINEQFGSEPLLNSTEKMSVEMISSKAKNMFLKNWNVDSKKVLFSDDDSEIHYMNSNIKEPNHSFSENQEDNKILEFHICTENQKLDCSVSKVNADSLCNVEAFPELDANKQFIICHENSLLENEKSGNIINTQEEKKTYKDIKNYDVNNTVLMTDCILESVTSRTEALANQPTCFNRFRTRFKSGLES